MPKFTSARKGRLTRDRKGRFKNWSGGRHKSQLKKKQNTFQGIVVHIGKEYKRQRGRTARPGAIVRTKKKDGSYHKGAYWYVRTPKGWRKTNSTRRPSRATINKILKRARTGRP